MRDSQNLLSGKGKYLFGMVLLFFIALLCGAFSTGERDDFEVSKREILLRRIGHELLLQSGDSTSRVLPVKKISENEYQIAFEKELTFTTEALVAITQRLLNQDPLTDDYIVNVLNCEDDRVVYGFAISKNRKNTIISCIGRKQPRGCYILNITFKPTRAIIAKTGYLLGSLPILAFFGFILFRQVKKRKPLPNSEPIHSFTLGAVVFDVQQRKLHTEETTIDLTGTETRVLLIFAQSPNESIARSRLQKEIWEDEGVIVGRSLDMFISKLRKKLEVDPNLKIVVLRGKGYRLEIGG